MTYISGKQKQNKTGEKRFVMRYSIQLLTFIVIFLLPLINLNAGLVYFGNIKKKQCGFLVKSGEDYYAYTSQTALMGLGRFAIKSVDGVITLKSMGALEISYYSDIARMKVDPGKLKDQAYEIEGAVIMGMDVQVFSVSIADNIDSKSSAQVDGIGMYAFAFNKETDIDSTGTPVVSSDGKVVGVLSKGYKEFEITSRWNSGKVKIIDEKNKLAARLDVKVKWVSAGKADFNKASKAIADTLKFQEDFLPLLNWWCANPYRKLSGDVKFPKKLKAWVNDNNHKTKIYDKLVAKCAKNPIKHTGLIDSLTDSTLHRALKLSKFPQSNLRKMQIKWKTPYLRSRAQIYMTNWHKIDKMMERRLKSMEYLLPQSFKSKSDDAMESDKKKKKKK